MSVLSISESWSLTTALQRPATARRTLRPLCVSCTVFSRATSEAARSFAQIFFSSEAVTSDCRSATVWATLCCSPWKEEVDTLLAHPASDPAAARPARSAQRAFSRADTHSRVRARVLEEVLGEHRALMLVAGAGLLAVEDVGLGCHALECQLADGLAVLDHERDVAGAHLQRRAGAAAVPVGRVAEARIEEAGVVRAQLAGRGVVGEHLGGVAGGHAHA